MHLERKIVGARHAPPDLAGHVRPEGFWYSEKTRGKRPKNQQVKAAWAPQAPFVPQFD
jgi:hypothetical protein